MKDERVGDLFLVQNPREGRLQLGPSRQQHSYQCGRVPEPERDRSPPIGAHRRRRQPENSRTQRLHPRHEPRPLLPRPGLAVTVQLFHEVVGADGGGEGALGQVGAPPVIRDPLGLLANDVEDVRQRVGRGAWGETGVQRRARLEVEALDAPLVRRAASHVVRLAHAHRLAVVRQQSRG
eukprot:scaffold28841_cov101-Isochrysis_galbana.AAC.3